MGTAANISTRLRRLAKLPLEDRGPGSCSKTSIVHWHGLERKTLVATAMWLCARGVA